MHLNRQAPEFDLAMELLCSLPPEPAYVPIRELAADLGLGFTREVRHLISDLRLRGYEVETLRTCDGNGCRLAARGWAKAQAAAAAYWDRVYGSTSGGKSRKQAA